MMLDATQNLTAPLNDERLFAWHAALFPTGRSGMRKIIVGAWRDDARGPMQVVSGPVGREKVHCEAPAAPRRAQHELLAHRRIARSSLRRPLQDPTLAPLALGARINRGTSAVRPLQRTEEVS